MNVLRFVAGILSAFGQWFVSCLFLYPGVWVAAFNDGPPRSFLHLLPSVLIFVVPGWFFVWLVGFGIAQAEESDEVRFYTSAGRIVGGMMLFFYGLWWIVKIAPPQYIEDILFPGSFWVIPGTIIIMQGLIEHCRTIKELAI